MGRVGWEERERADTGKQTQTQTTVTDRINAICGQVLRRGGGCEVLSLAAPNYSWLEPGCRASPSREGKDTDRMRRSGARGCCAKCPSSGRVCLLSPAGGWLPTSKQAALPGRSFLISASAIHSGHSANLGISCSHLGTMCLAVMQFNWPAVASANNGSLNCRHWASSVHQHWQLSMTNKACSPVGVSDRDGGASHKWTAEPTFPGTARAAHGWPTARCCMA